MYCHLYTDQTWMYIVSFKQVRNRFQSWSFMWIVRNEVWGHLKSKMATMLTGLPDGAIHKFMDGLMDADLKWHIFFVFIIHFNCTRIKEKNYAPHFPTFWSAKPAVCFSSTWFFLSIRYFVFSFIFVHLHTLEWNNLSYIRLCTLCTYSVQKTWLYECIAISRERLAREVLVCSICRPIGA